VKVLQPAQQPQAPTAEATANVVIDTITYDTKGEVALVGRGQGDGFVRIYLNDKPILTVPVEPDGTWETPLADVDAGVYRLRVDEISTQGDVTSRVETPFQREEVELAADAPPTAVTVQPGSTLWAIAKDRFGDGIEYIRVYEANRELIRDPDLIYPGQVFALPTE
jgi:nucleoid-associated protein YgaU